MVRFFKKRFVMLLSRRALCFVSGLMLLALPADIALAQRGGGGFGRTQTRARYELATLPEVQADLKLSDDQKKLASDLLAKGRERAGGGGGGGGADFAAMMAERAKMMAEFDAQFVAKLDDAQKSRLNGLLAQVNGAASLLDTAIASAMKLSEEQNAKLKSVNDSNRSARRDAMAGFQDKSPEERQELTTKLAEKENGALLAVLSDEQKKKFEEFKGASLKIDTAPLRMPRNRN
jgi:hypothetical protein